MSLFQGDSGSVPHRLARIHRLRVGAVAVRTGTSMVLTDFVVFLKSPLRDLWWMLCPSPGGRGQAAAE